MVTPAECLDRVSSVTPKVLAVSHGSHALWKEREKEERMLLLLCVYIIIGLM